MPAVEQARAAHAASRGERPGVAERQGVLGQVVAQRPGLPRGVLHPGKAPARELVAPAHRAAGQRLDVGAALESDDRESCAGQLRGENAPAPADPDDHRIHLVVEDDLLIGGGGAHGCPPPAGRRRPWA